MDELSERYFGIITKMIKENKTTKELEKTMNTNNKFYSWYINPYNLNEVMIYKQEKEDENSYDCISHIIEQLLEENNNYTFHLN